MSSTTSSGHSSQVPARSLVINQRTMTPGGVEQEELLEDEAQTPGAQARELAV